MIRKYKIKCGCGHEFEFSKEDIHDISTYRIGNKNIKINTLYYYVVCPNCNEEVTLLNI